MEKAIRIYPLKPIILIIGIIIALLISIYQAIILKEPHFYSLFSIGMFLILLSVYNKISKKNMFKDWKTKEIVVFSIFLVLSCILIDKIGMSLGYWDYPHYNTLFDEVLKYLFEWATPFLYITLAFMIGFNLFQKAKFKKNTSFILSLLIFVTFIGFITDTINLPIYSWRITNMPLTNTKIGYYFLIFSTVGYWLMACLTYSLYNLIEYWKKK